MGYSYPCPAGLFSGIFHYRVQLSSFCVIVWVLSILASWSRTSCSGVKHVLFSVRIIRVQRCWLMVCFVLDFVHVSVFQFLLFHSAIPFSFFHELLWCHGLCYWNFLILCCSRTSWSGGTHVLFWCSSKCSSVVSQSSWCAIWESFVIWILSFRLVIFRLVTILSLVVHARLGLVASTSCSGVSHLSGLSCAVHLLSPVPCFGLRSSWMFAQFVVIVKIVMFVNDC